jgi:hypothetical protein
MERYLTAPTPSQKGLTCVIIKFCCLEISINVDMLYIGTDHTVNKRWIRAESGVIIHTGGSGLVM